MDGLCGYQEWIFHNSFNWGIPKVFHVCMVWQNLQKWAFLEKCLNQYTHLRQQGYQFVSFVSKFLYLQGDTKQEFKVILNKSFRVYKEMLSFREPRFYHP